MVVAVMVPGEITIFRINSAKNADRTSWVEFFLFSSFSGLVSPFGDGGNIFS